MRKLFAALLLLVSSVVIAAPEPIPSDTEWVSLSENAIYKVLDTRDDILMFRFLFVYRDVELNRVTFSFWYANCDENKASAYRHQYAELSSGGIYEDQEHPANWIYFEENGNGWKIMQAECKAQLNRVKQT